MNGRGKSDSSVVPGKPPNDVGQPTEEAVEGRELAKGNSPESNAFRTQRRGDARSALERVRRAARKDRKKRFTALLHHVYDLDRLRDAYLIGDIEKDTARGVIERLRELANDNDRPITLYINSAGGNVTDGLAIHDAIRQLVHRGITVTIIVQGMAYSMGSVVLQAASDGRRLSLPHSWIMIHEPAKWAGWQSTSAAAQHLDRLKQMQGQIYEIPAKRSGRPLQKIIRDTKRTDLYLDAKKELEYGLIDGVLEG